MKHLGIGIVGGVALVGLMAAGVYWALHSRSTLQDTPAPLASGAVGKTQSQPKSAAVELGSDAAMQRSDVPHAPPAASPEPSASPGKPSETGEVQVFRKKYAELSYNELQLKRRELGALLAELSAPAFDEYRMRGDYEVVGVGQKYTPEGWDNSQLARVRVPSKGSDDQRVLKIVLRENDYPELLAMRREELWLDDRMAELLAMNAREGALQR